MTPNLVPGPDQAALPAPFDRQLPVSTPDAPDPVNLLSPAMVIYLPVGKAETNTMVGLWFSTVGLLHVYIQQALFPDNIFAQVKITTMRLPVAMGFLVFNLGLALFFVRSFIEGIRGASAETANEIQQMLDKVMRKIKAKTPRQ